MMTHIRATSDILFYLQYFFILSRGFFLFLFFSSTKFQIRMHLGGAYECLNKNIGRQISKL